MPNNFSASYVAISAVFNDVVSWIKLPEESKVVRTKPASTDSVISLVTSSLTYLYFLPTLTLLLIVSVIVFVILPASL